MLCAAKSSLPKMIVHVIAMALTLDALNFISDTCHWQVEPAFCRSKLQNACNNRQISCFWGTLRTVTLKCNTLSYALRVAREKWCDAMQQCLASSEAAAHSDGSCASRVHSHEHGPCIARHEDLLCRRRLNVAKGTLLSCLLHLTGREARQSSNDLDHQA